MVFRSTASTLLNESGKWNPDAIERALSHAEGNQIRAAYHRGAYWPERIKMAQWWSDHLDTLRAWGEGLRFPSSENFKRTLGRSRGSNLIIC